MAFLDVYAAATTESLTFKQVVVAIKRAAFAIMNEDPGTANHDKRIQWTRNVHLTEDGPIKYAKKFVWRVLDNATVAASLPDSVDGDVEFAVNSLIDEFAIG